MFTLVTVTTILTLTFRDTATVFTTHLGTSIPLRLLINCQQVQQLIKLNGSNTYAMDTHMRQEQLPSMQ